MPIMKGQSVAKLAWPGVRNGAANRPALVPNLTVP